MQASSEKAAAPQGRLMATRLGPVRATDPLDSEAVAWPGLGGGPDLYFDWLPPDALPAVDRRELAERAPGVIADQRHIAQVERSDELGDQPRQPNRTQVSAPVERHFMRSERPIGPSPSVRKAYGPATELAAELVLNGRRRTAARGWPGWPRAITETEECGYHQMAAAIRRVQATDQGMSAALSMLKLLALARDTSG